MKSSKTKKSIQFDAEVIVKPIGKKSRTVVSEKKKSAIIGAILKYEEELSI